MNKKILGLIISLVFITSVGILEKENVKDKIKNVNNKMEYLVLGNNQELNDDNKIKYESTIKDKEIKELLYEGSSPAKEKKVDGKEKSTSAQEENQNTNETSSNGSNNNSEKQNSSNESSLNNSNSSSKESQKANSSSKGSASQGAKNPSLKHVQIEGNVSSDRAIQIDKLISSSIPSNIVSKFKTIGGKIIVTAKDIATNYSISNKTAGSISALYKHSPSNTIYVQGSSKSTSSVIHEFGHFVDAMAGSTKSNGKLSTTFGRSEIDDFKNDIFQQEKDAIASYLHSDYAKNSSTECFAEAFKIYIQNSGTLKSIAPRTYEVISEAVNSI